MNTVRNLSRLLCFLLIFSFVICAPPGNSEDEDVKTKADSDSSEEESNENNMGTISPAEMEALKEKIIEIQVENAEKFDLPLTSSPEEIETYLEKEEKEYGKDLPEKVEEAITESEDLDNLIRFVALFDEIKSVASEDGEEVKPISPEEMKQMKEDVFNLVNEKNEQAGIPKISQEDFDRIWKEKEEEYGDKFPRKIEKLVVALKEVENDEEGKEENTSITPNVLESSTSESEESKAEVPEDVFALKNMKGKICILAKFQSGITITYEGKSRDQTIHLSIPASAHVKGKCGGENKSPVMQLSWENFLFEFLFEKDDDSWFVSKVEFSYDTGEPVFDGAANAKKIVAKSQKSLFETPLGKSYFCTAKEVILLFSNEEQVALVELRDVHIQPYGVEGGKFSASHRCDKVVIGGLDDEPFVQDETVPLAVGLTLALITLLVLVGFSVHRAYMAARVDYNNMDTM